MSRASLICGPAQNGSLKRVLDTLLCTRPGGVGEGRASMSLPAPTGPPREGPPATHPYDRTGEWPPTCETVVLLAMALYAPRDSNPQPSD
jgi:hypothetical protein